MNYTTPLSDASAECLVSQRYYVPSLCTRSAFLLCRKITLTLLVATLIAGLLSIELPPVWQTVRSVCYDSART